MKEASKEGGGGHGVATVTVAVRMGAVGMTAAARVATGTAAVMEVVKGGCEPRVTTAGRKAWKRVVAAGGDGGRGEHHIEFMATI